MLKRQSGGWWWEPPKGMPTHVYTVRIEDTCIVHRVGMRNAKPHVLHVIRVLWTSQ